MATTKSKWDEEEGILEVDGYHLTIFTTAIHLLTFLLAWHFSLPLTQSIECFYSLVKGFSVVFSCSAWLLPSLFLLLMAISERWLLWLNNGLHTNVRDHWFPFRKMSLKFSLVSWRSHWSTAPSSSFFLLPREL